MMTKTPHFRREKERIYLFGEKIGGANEIGEAPVSLLEEDFRGCFFISPKCITPYVDALACTTEFPTPLHYEGREHHSTTFFNQLGFCFG